MDPDVGTCRFQSSIDGAASSDNCGAGVDPRAPNVVSSLRLYQIAHQNGTVEDRTFEIWLLDSSMHAYSLGFG